MNADWSGTLLGWKHNAATTGPPGFTKAPLPEKTSTNEKAYRNAMKLPHPFIITQDHDEHVEGHVITSLIPPGSVALANPPAHYGIVTTKPDVQIVKSPVKYAKKTALVDPKNIPFPQTLTDENLKKLREDRKSFT